jgi:hypothetical protein
MKLQDQARAYYNIDFRAWETGVSRGKRSMVAQGISIDLFDSRNQKTLAHTGARFFRIKLAV